MSTDQTHDHPHDTGFEHEYDWLVREDTTTWRSGSDLAALVGPGTRRLHRRRLGVVTGAAGLLAAAVAVPALGLGGTGADPVRQVVPDRTTPPSQAPYAGTDSGPDDEPAPDPSTMRGCGAFSCVERGETPDTNPVQGELMTIGRTPTGLDEVVWASERTLYDPVADKDVVGTVLMTGFVRGAERVDGVFALQPGHEFTPSCVGSFYLALTADGGWAILGHVDGEAAAVTYSGGTGDGTAQSSTTVLPGSTVFVARGTGTGDADLPTSFTAGSVTAPVAGCATSG